MRDGLEGAGEEETSRSGGEPGMVANYKDGFGRTGTVRTTFCPSGDVRRWDAACGRELPTVADRRYIPVVRRSQTVATFRLVLPAVVAGEGELEEDVFFLGAGADVVDHEGDAFVSLLVADDHDVPGTAELVLSMHAGVWRFDREKKEFRRDPELGERKIVKCVEPPADGRVLVVQASEEQWWTDAIELLKPEGKVRLEDETVYEARWMELRCWQ